MWAHFVVINRCWTIADDNDDVMNWEGGICWPEWQSHWMIGVVLVGCDFHLHAKATEFTCIFHLVDSALTGEHARGNATDDGTTAIEIMSKNCSIAKHY